MTNRFDFSPAMALARAEMNRLHRLPEPEVVRPLLAALPGSGDEAAIMARGKALIAELRKGQSNGWVNRFMSEYRMDSDEGLALLSLAEAFLRVPDPATADLLIADKIGEADWRAHSGKSSSMLVNSATWGLVLGRAVIGVEPQAGVLRRLIARSGEPFVRQAVGAAMRLMGEVFVMGRTIDEALGRMRKSEHKGFTASFDMLGEGARTFGDARRYFESYENAIASVGKASGEGHSISVKLSALHPRYEAAQADACLPELTAMLLELARGAAHAGIPLTIDAEESERLDLSFDIIAAVAADPALKGWDGLGMAVQAYSRRARSVCRWAGGLGEATGRRIKVRLVKGAYWDSEIKATQEQGLADYPLFTRKAHTDVSYLAAARELLASPWIEPAFASHNARTVATIVQWAQEAGRTGGDFEFQRLHGMGEGLYEKLVREQGYRCRIYAPVGGHRDLLAYLVRRLLENGANTSFVHQLADADLSEEDLLADPVAKAQASGGLPHPSIPLPRDLFEPLRGNSAGIDLNDRAVLADVAGKLARQPAIALAGNEVRAAIDTAAAATTAWAAIPVERRAEVLERLADLIEQRRDEAFALLVQEARKTLPDALAEVREAADFCRYYARQACDLMQPAPLPGPTGESNVLRLHPRGVWAAIAPWNFPLAIFLGQVAAGLVTGNTVVAKPAPQTPDIARWAVALAHEAGVPVDALRLVTGGAEAGAALVGDARVMGVAFTGSVPTAKRIARTLLEDDARPIVPLIAETGGINAMVVDSTALPEQVVRDIVTSAFRSAGQRCSALRLLLVQEEISDRTLEMLAGAMDALVIGDPADPATDVGPVIDRAAYDKLMGRRAAMAGRIVKTVAVPGEGLFVPPTVIRLDSVDDLDAEWFGPLLHVATWKTGTLEQVIAAINAKGFGLTMGLHSRIARVAETVEGAARVGNLYVNRSMIGAVVGSQPFGGEGLSGTGPKAGGPHYLARFCVERVTSTDTTSAGGNASLLSLDEEL
ncbi:L-glutamate gamma-semialdehyde dehydrogenase [Novosphingobium sp. KCTC 2891]|uniref:L-glutamate gamma-semialdehyde dehydrogenase n=1 Tax=Novosphingobium sp. KCTC 2891 TaxID=2989730 RepID=UPI0022234DC9|nr:L-glutamate gamma-semialdehyde dehydrogenase [Novosphingobium sp. KCTC 2891]MCW1383942.1 L-glutamate gamma-semialdehyde dehydrogenase [Novosphingobium sp. KCTC 2891]